MKRVGTVVAVTFVLMAVASSSAWAQPGGRGGFRGGFGGTPNLLDLVRVEAVQKEIEALDDQVAGIKKLDGELTAARDAQRGQGPRPDFQNMSQQERDKAMADMRARREKETAAANAKLGEILLPHQVKRLQEISLQTRGIMALSDPKVAAELKITGEQKKKLEEAASANMESMRTLFQGGNRGDQDREQMRAKMQDMRKQAEAKVLAVLTADQKAQFEKMKGEAFQMPEGALGFGGRQGRGGRGGEGARPGGKERPQRPNN